MDGISSNQNAHEDELRQVIREALSAAPSGFPEQSAACSRLLSLVRQEFALALTTQLQAHLGKFDDRTLATRRALASSTNSALRTLGLAIRCPTTMRPSIIIVDPYTREDGKGRFRLENRDQQRKVERTLSSVEVPPLEVMEDAPRVENLAGRALRKTARPEGGQSR